MHLAFATGSCGAGGRKRALTVMGSRGIKVGRVNSQLQRHAIAKSSSTLISPICLMFGAQRCFGLEARINPKPQRSRAQRCDLIALRQAKRIPERKAVAVSVGKVRDAER